MRHLTGKTWVNVLEAFGHQYASLFLFFGAVWIAVVVAGNWAPARTAPRIAVLAAAVLVGLVVGNLLSARSSAGCGRARRTRRRC